MNATMHGLIDLLDRWHGIDGVGSDPFIWPYPACRAYVQIILSLAHIEESIHHRARYDDRSVWSIPWWGYLYIRRSGKQLMIIRIQDRKYKYKWIKCRRTCRPIGMQKHSFIFYFYFCQIGLYMCSAWLRRFRGALAIDSYVLITKYNLWRIEWCSRMQLYHARSLAHRAIESLLITWYDYDDDDDVSVVLSFARHGTPNPKMNGFYVHQWGCRLM
jgi:hypothetical protein